MHAVPTNSAEDVAAPKQPCISRWFLVPRTYRFVALDLGLNEIKRFLTDHCWCIGEANPLFFRAKYQHTRSLAVFRLRPSHLLVAVGVDLTVENGIFHYPLKRSRRPLFPPRRRDAPIVQNPGRSVKRAAVREEVAEENSDVYPAPLPPAFVGVDDFTVEYVAPFNFALSVNKHVGIDCRGIPRRLSDRDPISFSPLYTKGNLFPLSFNKLRAMREDRPGESIIPKLLADRLQADAIPLQHVVNDQHLDLTPRQRSDF